MDGASCSKGVVGRMCSCGNLNVRTIQRFNQALTIARITFKRKPIWFGRGYWGYCLPIIGKRFNCPVRYFNQLAAPSIDFTSNNFVCTPVPCHHWTDEIQPSSVIDFHFIYANVVATYFQLLMAHDCFKNCLYLFHYIMVFQLYR